MERDIKVNLGSVLEDIEAEMQFAKMFLASAKASGSPEDIAFFSKKIEDLDELCEKLRTRLSRGEV